MFCSGLNDFSTGFLAPKYHTVIMGISQQGFRTGDPYDYGGLNLIYVNTIIMNNHSGAGHELFWVSLIYL